MVIAKKSINTIINIFNNNIVNKYKKSIDRDNLNILSNIDGMISLEEGKLLFNLAQAVNNNQNNCIVEIGSYRGRSTTALALGSINGNKVPIFAVDPHENFTGILGGEFGGKDRGIFFQNMLDTSCFEIVRLINSSSEIITPGWKKEVSLLWIDGDHSYEGVKRDYECWKPFLTEESIIVFDDSLDRSIGPVKLIEDLVTNEGFNIVHQVGKVTVIKHSNN